jgi:hypothetical protein
VGGVCSRRIGGGFARWLVEQHVFIALDVRVLRSSAAMGRTTSDASSAKDDGSSSEDRVLPQCGFLVRAVPPPHPNPLVFEAVALQVP